MARPARLVVDETALTGRYVDVGARAGWVLRMARLGAGSSLGAMTAALRERGVRTSVPQLSRIETGALRLGVVTDAYEAVLGRGRGELRAAVDILARTFRRAGEDQQPEPAGIDLAAYDAAVEPVLASDPSGGDWLLFARAHARESIGLPSSLMRPLVDQLACETVRGVGPAFVTRYEALTRLRLGSYGGVVAAVVIDAVREPGYQALAELTSALAERPTPGMLRWVAGLLDHEREGVAEAATIGIINSRAVGGLAQPDWRPVPPAFLAAWASARGSPSRRARLVRLFANLPPQLRGEIAEVLGEPVPRPGGPVDWTPHRRNRHYATAERVADEACRRAGLPEQPMLTRLVFEMLHDYRPERAATSAWLVGATELAPHLLPLLVELAADSGYDAATRHRAAAAAASAQRADHAVDPAPLLAADDPDVRSAALRIAAHAGRRLDAPTRSRLLTEQPEATLYALGMAADPALRDVARSAAYGAEVRDSARWWLANGGRVVS